jgi:hypothetical protein
MDKAKKRFTKKTFATKEKAGLNTVTRSVEKDRENELLAADNESGAPASSDMFEPEKVEDNVDYTDGGTVR